VKKKNLSCNTSQRICIDKPPNPVLVENVEIEKDFKGKCRDCGSLFLTVAHPPARTRASLVLPDGLTHTPSTKIRFPFEIFLFRRFPPSFLIATRIPYFVKNLFRGYPTHSCFIENSIQIPNSNKYLLSIRNYRKELIFSDINFFFRVYLNSMNYRVHQQVEQ
jgi:hypothetical protein